MGFETDILILRKDIEMKKSMILLFFTGIFVMVLLVTGCQQPSSPSGGGGETKTYSIYNIGPSGVGIVFYISNGGLHGLEAAPSLWNGGAEDPTSVWSNVDSTLIGVTSQGIAIGTGLVNTNAIIVQSGHTAGAAKLCRDYTGGGKTDWLLPSIDELDRMRSVLASTLIDRTTYGFAENIYWSSSEVNASQAWYEGFTLGITANDAAKLNHIYVRAIRAF
jgi:hypothetical protein